MTLSERHFAFSSDTEAKTADRDKWRRHVQTLRESEIQDAADRRRRNADLDERDRAAKLERRNAIALAYLRRVPLDRVPTTQMQLRGIIGNPFQIANLQKRRSVTDKILHWIWTERYVFDDGITYPDTVRIAQILMSVDEDPDWLTSLSLPYVMLAEEIQKKFDSFGRPNPV